MTTRHTTLAVAVFAVLAGCALEPAPKPEDIRPKIVEGMLDKWLGEVVLLRQPHVNADRHEGRTIEEMRADLSAKTGENIVIRRFVRYAVGE